MQSLSISPKLKKHLLIVDDDKRIRLLLQEYLQKYNYRVTTAESAEHSRSLLKYFNFDLLIIDVMMPGENGLSLTDYVINNVPTPVILLTALSEIDDKIKGLESGADDYLVKPFDPRELVLRVESIMRRDSQWDTTTEKSFNISFGEFKYDTKRQELHRGTQLISLTNTETLLLQILTENSNKIITRENLNRQLNDNNHQFKKAIFNIRTVDVQITRLRQKIEIDSKSPRYLKTVRGQGYLLIPD